MKTALFPPFAPESRSALLYLLWCVFFDALFLFYYSYYTEYNRIQLSSVLRDYQAQLKTRKSTQPVPRVDEKNKPTSPQRSSFYTARRNIKTMKVLKSYSYGSPSSCTDA